jgi:hypothetical protein
MRLLLPNVNKDFAEYFLRIEVSAVGKIIVVEV